MQITSSAPQPQAPKLVALGPDQGHAVWFLDTLVTIKLRGADGAEVGVLENAMPEGSRTPFHVHDDEDESLYVLDGCITVYLEDGRVMRAEAGAYVHLPRGTAHGFRADTAATLLVLSAPNGFVEFVREMGVPAPRRELPPAGQPDMMRLIAVAGKYGIRILGPLPE